ncbi:hypothetical protein AB1283_04110 [Bacillus sp. S13(2024)]|uniref:hypothetical protein n=1 Tax=unclassified Bacillus (in: firmicutes) TaxID=185979 RepID=UPI003D24F567
MDAYNLLIRFGRFLDQGHEFEPEIVLATIEFINKKLQWTPVEDFFRVFPPIKEFEDDGSWDYKSTLEYIKENYGERFGKDDFIDLLMTHCYENRYVRELDWPLCLPHQH